MGERSDHAPQRREALVPSKLLLQPAGFREVGQQHQLPWLALQRARGNGNTPSVAQRYLMAIVAARGEALGDNVTPEAADQIGTQQVQRGRIGLVDNAASIDHHYPTGQQIQKALVPSHKAFFLGDLLLAQQAGSLELAGQLSDTRFDVAIGDIQLPGQARQIVKRPLFRRGNGWTGCGVVGGCTHGSARLRQGLDVCGAGAMFVP
jgi:hypothetical protein